MNTGETAGILAASISPDFVISVSGHRDIPEDDFAALQSQLEAVFQELQSRFRHLQVRLVTGLARTRSRPRLP